MGKLLLIVDMLNDFIEQTGKLYFEKGQGVIAPITRLKAAFRAVGAPQLYVNDAHPPDSQEFAVWPPHCVVGSWGARIIDALAPGPGDVVLHKDALTLFAEAAADGLLRGFGASRLYLAGVATEYCVKACALDAVAQGFAVTVIVDAIAGVDMTPGDAERALAAMEQAGVAFATTDAVIAGLA